MSDFSPSRRQLLSCGLVGVLTAGAGCLGLGSDGGGDSGNGIGDSGRTLRLTLARDDGPLREQFVVDLSKTRPDWDEDAFAAARNGERYTTQYRTPFLSNPDDPTYTRHDGTYYRLGSVVVDERTAVHPVLRLSAVGDAADASTPESVAASELPERDQRAVRVAYFAARARGNSGGVPWGLVQRGGYVYRDDEAVDASELLADDGPSHVTFRETTYAVAVARETFHEPVYRATVEPVAKEPERMEAILRAQFVDARFTRDDLSAAARDVVETARGDGYGETHPYSEGFREVLRTLHRRAYLDGNVRKDAGVGEDGRRMLRYDGVYYDYRLRFSSSAEQ